MLKKETVIPPADSDVRDTSIGLFVHETIWFGVFCLAMYNLFSL